MKKLLSLSLIYTFIACGGDDDINLDNDITFLEKYDGFGYQAGGIYIYFSNSATFIKSVETGGEADGNECQEIQEDSNIRIVTNNSTSLLFEENYSDEDYPYVLTYECTVDASGNTLTIKFDNDPNDVVTYTKTTVTYASLCD